MSTDGIAQNGNTPVTRRECAERHEQSLAEAKKAIAQATDAAESVKGWILKGIVPLFCVGWAVLALFINVRGGAGDEAVRKAIANEVKIEATIQARLESNTILMNRLDSMQKSLDELNKSIRDDHWKSK